MKWLAAMLVLFALAGCGGGASSSAPPTTTTVPTTTQAAPAPNPGFRPTAGTRKCGAMVGGASNVVATNVDCRLARLVARIGKPIGWHCKTTNGRVVCKRSNEVVRYSPPS